MLVDLRRWDWMAPTRLMNSGCARTTISNRRNETKNDLSRHRVCARQPWSSVERAGLREKRSRPAPQYDGMLTADSTTPMSELVCEPDLEIMLHQRHLIGNGQWATRGRSATSTTSRFRKAEGSEAAEGGIPEI
jgi:hypothetical protein